MLVKPRHRALLFSALALTATAATLALPAVANARDAPSVTVSAATIAVGTVTNNGAPIANSSVDLYAWPNPAVLAKLGSGQSFQLLKVASTATNSAGAFSLSVDWAQLPQRYRYTTGAANFTAVADDGTRQLPWYLPGVAKASAGTADPSVAIVGQRPDRLRFELGAHSGVASKLASSLSASNDSRSRTPAGLFAEATIPARVAGYATPDSAGTGSCIGVPGAWTYGVDERFAAVYAWSGAQATITQTSGAGHTLGIGYQVGSGAWSQNGTAGLSETTGSGASRDGVVDAWAHNRVNYRAFSVTCGGPTFHTRMAVSTYALLSSYTYAPHVTWGACNRYTGGTYWKTRGANSTIGGGINLGFVSLTAQSGWNTETDMAWTVTKPTMICGSSAAGWSASPQAEAHAG